MPVTVDWVEKPHILQIVYQGKVTLDEIIGAWEQIEQFYLDSQIHPFCNLTVILPDREIPVGLLQLATHPIVRVLRYVDVSAICGVDHVMVGKLVETIASLPFAPEVHMVKSYESGLNYLQQIIRAEQAGV